MNYLVFTDVVNNSILPLPDCRIVSVQSDEWGRSSFWAVVDGTGKEYEVHGDWLVFGGGIKVLHDHDKIKVFFEPITITEYIADIQ